MPSADQTAPPSQVRPPFGGRVEALLARRPWTSGLVLVFVTVLCWANTVHSGTVNRDTPWLVVENPILRSGSWSAIPDIVWGMDLGTRNTLGAEYLPVRDLTVLLDFALFGDWWWGHHLHNLVWYTLGCWFFLRLLETLFRPGVGTLALGLLFACLPVHAENIAWLAGRKDVVSMALFFAAAWAASRSDRGLWVAVACFVAAVWAKNTTIVLPAVVLALLWFQGRLPRWRAWALPMVTMGAVTLATLAISTRLGSMVGMYADPRVDGPGELVVLQGRMLIRYAELFLWPPALAALHPEPSIVPLSQPANVAGLIVYLGLIALGTWGVVRGPKPVGLGIVWFFVTMLPVSQLAPIQNLLADRYLLLPSAGLVVALGALPARFLQPTLGLIPVLVWASWMQSRVWHDSVALWQDVVDAHPDLDTGWTKLAGAYDLVGDPRLDQHLEEMAQRFPASAEVTASLGGHALDAGDLAKAEGLLRRALQLDPTHRKALGNLVVCLNRQGRFADAAVIAEVLVREHPLYAHGWNAAGVAWMNLQPQRALAAFERALEIEPDHERALCNRSYQLFNLRSPMTGLALQACLERVPGDAQAKQLLDMMRSGGP